MSNDEFLLLLVVTVWFPLLVLGIIVIWVDWSVTKMKDDMDETAVDVSDLKASCHAFRTDIPLIWRRLRRLEENIFRRDRAMTKDITIYEAKIELEKIALVLGFDDMDVKIDEDKQKVILPDDMKASIENLMSKVQEVDHESK